LHNSVSLLTNTAIEDGTQYEERTPPSRIDPAADQQCRSSTEMFVNRKLKLLRAKLESLTEADTIDKSDLTVQPLLQTNSSLEHSEKAENTYTEACLGRLNVSKCPTVNQSRSTQSATVTTTKPFTVQHERLKMELLQHTIEMQIKVHNP
jgi:hypothetical protein